MSPITIHPATKDDAELIADLSRQTFYDTFAADNTKANMDKFMEQQFSKRKLMQEVGVAPNVFFIAKMDDEVVGYLKLKEGLDHSIEIARIYSVKHAIGKGVGKVLMQTSLDYAKQKGSKMIWLGVWQQNYRAIDFYTKWGFQKFDEHDFILGDDVQKDWLMKKTLNAG